MYIPLNVHSHYSLKKSILKPNQITERCVEIGANACAITDYGSLSGVVSFMKSCKGTCQCGHQKGIHIKQSEKCNQKGCPCASFSAYTIKPILGCVFYITKDDPSVKTPANRPTTNLTVLAKNLQGWKSLIEATSEANKPEHMYYEKPRLNLERLTSFARDNFIVLSGSIGSELSNILFTDFQLAYRAKNKDMVKSFLKSDYIEQAAGLIKKYKEMFGESNFYAEIQRIDIKNMPVAEVVSDILRTINIKKVATPSPYYCRREDAGDQRVHLCSGLETTMSAVERKIDSSDDSILKSFFQSNNYHMASPEEMVNIHTKEEIDNTILISELCENYDILAKPTVPSFLCPNNLSGADYLRNLCREGWKKKISKKVPKELHSQYAERVKYELEVITGYPLLINYFLIVADYMTWARERFLCGGGRGSGAGSLVSHLLNITDVDPIIYDLLWSRFYNAGRNTADRISLPDIDCDFPISRRAEVKAYIKSKYGDNRVCEMITFSRMQGRGALKDVFRAHETCSFEEMNAVTEFIPDEAEISDELQLMREATGEASIILWALQNNSEGLKQWCYLDDDGELQGPYAKRFAQAIRLEGTKRSPGKHAAGIIISASNLSEVCPMVYDKNTNQLIAGLEMNDLEAMGHTKFDILGVAVLDKIMGVQQLLKTGKI